MSRRITRLRRRMIEDMSVRNLSPATQASYITAVKKFSRYYRRSPEHLGVEDVRAYEVHLVEDAIASACSTRLCRRCGFSMASRSVERICPSASPMPCRDRAGRRGLAQVSGGAARGCRLSNAGAACEPRACHQYANRSDLRGCDGPSGAQREPPLDRGRSAAPSQRPSCRRRTCGGRSRPRNVPCAVPQRASSRRAVARRWPCRPPTF